MIAALVAAAVLAQPVTLEVAMPEGWSARQMADRVAEVRQIAIRKRKVTPRLTGTAYRAAVAKARAPRAFRRYLRRPCDLTQSGREEGAGGNQGFPSRSTAVARAVLSRVCVEGFLFPARYRFTPETTGAQLVSDQILTFEQRWATVDLRAARGRNPYEVLTIASMIEREVVVPSERALVSAVVHNRLDRDMALAIDATLRYGLGVEGTRPLTQKHLASDSPYNTRRFKGLPPTPIGNPGLASIRAAAKPAGVDYLYYVRKPNSVRHFFTADENEFCAKVEEYGYGGC